MKRIQAKKHKIGTYEIDKISLSCFDDKRFVLDNGDHTFIKIVIKNVIRMKIKIIIIIIMLITIIIIIIIKIIINENDK